MSLPQPINAAPTMEEERPELITFALQIVSPSVGVTGPLAFTHLLASTTVKQLKQRIREALPMKPADESQRLIHRGRMLKADSETMLDIFGHETLASTEPQTLHLVLRPATADGPSIQAPTPSPTPPGVSHHHHHHHAGLRHPMPPNQTNGMQAQQPLPGFQHIQQQQVHHQQDLHHQMTAQRLQHLQRENDRLHAEMAVQEARYRHHLAESNGQLGAGILPLAAPPGIFGLPQVGGRATTTGIPSVQNLIGQNQRERAAGDLQGAQEASGISTPPISQPGLPGRASPSIHRPDHTTTYTREGLGPNGDRWQVTVNETMTTIPTMPHHRHPHLYPHAEMPQALDLQAVLRNANRALAAQILQNNMERAASNPPQANAESSSVAHGSGFPPSDTLGSMVTPTTSSPASSEHLNPPTSTTTSSSALTAPMVYILSSPAGPRAILINNSESFFIPRQPLRLHRNGSPAPLLGQRRASGPISLPEFRNRPVGREHRQQHRREPNAPIAAHPGNPGAGALAAAIWPHFWLIVRLMGFVWFFTSDNNSWSRLFMICGLAVIVFIVNSGIFNGIAEQVWGPIRRHLENLLPLAGPDAVLLPAVNAAAPRAGAPAPERNEAATGARAQTDPDPAQVAARLLEERRQANGGWLMAQIRRAEHAMLLFLASLVPGVGERHIAAREAEAAAAEAERQRQEAVAAEVAGGEQPEGSGAEQTPEAEAEGAGRDQSRNAADGGAPDQPLIEI